MNDATPPDAAHNALVGASTAWRPGVAALPWVRRRELNDGERDEIRYGRPVERGDVRLPPAGERSDGAGEERVALYASGGLVAIAEARDGRLYPKKVFDA